MLKHAMTKALNERKGKGIDLTIMIGGMPEEEKGKEESKKLGLAPDGTPVGVEEGTLSPGGLPEQVPMHQDEPQDKELIMAELQKMGLGKGSLAHKAMMQKKG